MLQMCNKFAAVLLFFSIARIQCCTRESLHFVRITVKPIPSDSTKSRVQTFKSGFDEPATVVLGIEGVPRCRENIQQYEEKLKDAYIINVHNHFVPTLEEGDVRNLEQLEELYLDDNSISVIQPDAFKRLPKISIISLSNNSLTEIHKGIFSDLNVKSIHLHNNKISKVEVGAFSNTPRLTELDLSNNLLTSLNSDWLNIPTLKKLFLNHNQLTKIAPVVFSNVDSLEVLNLSNNHIENIDASAVQLKHLRRLYLEGNDFKCIGDDVIQAFPAHLVLSAAPNDNLSCLCWNKLQKWFFKYYTENKDTIFFLVRHGEIQCNTEIVEMLQDVSTRLTALEKH